MAANPAFASIPRNGLGQVSVANALRDGSGTVVTIFTAGVNGSRVDKVTCKAAQTTTAGMVRLFVHDGANFRLAYELLVTAVTASATVASFTGTVPTVEQGFANDIFPLILPSGYSLRACTQVGEQINILAQGGDF